MSMASEQDANRAIREQQIRMDELLQGASMIGWQGLVMFKGWP